MKRLILISLFALCACDGAPDTTLPDYTPTDIKWCTLSINPAQLSTDKLAITDLTFYVRSLPQGYVLNDAGKFYMSAELSCESFERGLYAFTESKTGDRFFAADYVGLDVAASVKVRAAAQSKSD